MTSLPIDAVPAVAPGPPHPPGRADGWPLPARFALLQAGLLLYGVALSAMIRADVGLAPWDAFHQGLSRAVPGLTVGVASIAAGCVCQGAAWAWLRTPPGIGSVFNLVLVGLYIDLFLPRVPPAPALWAAWLAFGGGILGVGMATGAYIASGFGAGPRDSVALGLSRRTGWPIRYLRSGMELVVLALGWWMGARVGWGTLAFAVLAGPAMSAGMGLWGLKR